jgi:hypothetical protein
MDRPEYFVVRIYRRCADDPLRIEGTLEKVASGTQQPFASAAKLWALLLALAPAEHDSRT